MEKIFDILAKYQLEQAASCCLEISKSALVGDLGRVEEFLDRSTGLINSARGVKRLWLQVKDDFALKDTQLPPVEYFLKELTKPNLPKEDVKKAEGLNHGEKTFQALDTSVTIPSISEEIEEEAQGIDYPFIGSTASFDEWFNRDVFIDPQDMEDWVSEQLKRRGGDISKILFGREQVVWEFLNNFGSFILHEDEDLLILNKPPEVNSISGVKFTIGLLEVAQYLRGPDIRLAHRLDRGTSGVLAATKNREAWESLIKQFYYKKMSGLTKTYLALLDGQLKVDKPLDIRVPIAPLKNSDMMRVLGDDERINLAEGHVNTQTIFKPLAVMEHRSGEIFTVAEVDLITGKKHQIRVVAAQYLKKPIVGDYQYNPDTKGVQRPMLHAFQLELSHPTFGQRLSITAPIPEDMTEIVQNSRMLYISPNLSDSKIQDLVPVGLYLK